MSMPFLVHNCFSNRKGENEPVVPLGRVRVCLRPRSATKALTSAKKSSALPQNEIQPVISRMWQVEGMHQVAIGLEMVPPSQPPRSERRGHGPDGGRRRCLLPSLLQKELRGALINANDDGQGHGREVGATRRGRVVIIKARTEDVSLRR